MSEAEDVALPPIMPIYRVYRGFLNSVTHASLLAWAIDNEAKFEPSVVSDRNQHDPSVRRSLCAKEFGPMKPMLRRRLLSFVPTLIGDLRVTPFEPSGVELNWSPTMMAHSSSVISTRS